MSDKNSKVYKVNLESFDNGAPECWLEFQAAALSTIINGNSLTEGIDQFSLTHSALRGKAKQAFNGKAAELKEEMPANYIKCLQAMAEQVFPKGAFRHQHFYLHQIVHLM